MGAPSASPLPLASNNLRGILWMLAYSMCMAGMHTSIRHVAQEVHPFEVAFFRLLFGLLAVLPFFVRSGLAPLRTKRLGMLTLRGLLNVCAMLSFFTALSLAPLAEVTALSFAAPIFATVLAVAVFGERIGPRRLVAIGIGFAGTMVVLRPGLAQVSLGDGLALFSAFVWGTCMVIIKDLSRTESSATIAAYMSLVMAPLALIPAAFVWTWPSLEQLAWLGLIGILGGCGQLAMSEALRQADTHVVVPVDYAKLIWVSILGYLAFGEVPDEFVWLGGTMIFAATAYIAWRERAVARAVAVATEETP